MIQCSADCWSSIRCCLGQHAAHSSWRLPIGRSELLLPAETCSGSVLNLKRATSAGPMQGPCMGAAFSPPGSRRLSATVVCGTKPCCRGAGSPFSVFEGPWPSFSLAPSARSGTAARLSSAAVAMQRQANHGWPVPALNLYPALWKRRGGLGVAESSCWHQGGPMRRRVHVAAPGSVAVSSCWPRSAD